MTSRCSPDIADYAAHVGEVIGEHTLQGTVGKIAMTDLTASYTTHGASLTC